MGKALPKVAAVSLCLLLLLTGCVSQGEQGPAFPESSPTGPAMSAAQNGSGFGTASQPKSGWDSFVSTVTDNPVTRGVKSAGKKTVDTLTPAPREISADDPTSLNSPTPKADAAMYVSMAQVQVASNELDSAALTYEKALKQNKKYVPAIVGLAQVRFRQQRHEEANQLFIQARKLDPHNLAAMLGQAHYHDTRENMPEATRLYTEATQRHPSSAAAWNDLGLCLARQRRLPESQQTLQRAVQLEQTNILYRNNLATVLVELHRNDEALVHLQQVHGPAVGHYNLGFLLHRRGENGAAAEQFNLALRADPSMDSARHWLDKLRSEEGTQRASRPPLGRSAALMRGPDGRDLPLFARSAGKSHDLMAPPEIEHLAETGPLDFVEEEDASDEVELQPVEMVVVESIEPTPVVVEEFSEAPSVVMVSAIEVYEEEDAAKEELIKAATPKRAPLPRVRVNREYVPKAEPAKSSDANLGKQAPQSVDLETAMEEAASSLSQPQLVGKVERTITIPLGLSTNSPKVANRLQLADEKAMQLQSPPAETASASPIPFSSRYNTGDVLIRR